MRIISNNQKGQSLDRTRENSLILHLNVGSQSSIYIRQIGIDRKVRTTVSFTVPPFASLDFKQERLRWKIIGTLARASSLGLKHGQLLRKNWTTNMSDYIGKSLVL